MRPAKVLREFATYSHDDVFALPALVDVVAEPEARPYGDSDRIARLSESSLENEIVHVINSQSDREMIGEVEVHSTADAIEDRCVILLATWHKHVHYCSLDRVAWFQNDVLV